MRLTKAPGEFHIYTINGDLSSSAWVVVVFPETQEDEQTIGVSSPNNIPISNEIKQAFIETNIINWKQGYMFSAIDHAVSLMIIEIGAFVKGKSLNILPNWYYYMTTEDAAKLEILSGGESQAVIIKPLDINEGAEFLTSQWKYASADTLPYAKVNICRHPSTGVYLNGKLICGVLCHTSLLIGMLATDKEYRNKGYAQICMKSHLKRLAAEGYFPTSTVVQDNLASAKLHLKLGMKLSHECNYISYQPTKY